MREIVVAEDLLLAAGLADAFDHRVMVEGIRQDQAIGQELGDRRDAGRVRDIARGEEERRRLAMQVGEFVLELDQRMIGAGNIAGAAGAGAHAGRGLDHGADHLRMLAHAEIVVGAPHDDLARPLRRMPDRVREAAGDALEIRKYAVAALVMQARQGVREKSRVVHLGRNFGRESPGTLGISALLEAFKGVCRGVVALRRSTLRQNG